MRGWCLVLLLGLGACRQANPEWKGPSDSLGEGTLGDATADDATADGNTAADMTADGGSSETTGPQMCIEPNVLCGTQCIDVQSDKRNCGACDVTCEPSEKCTDGVCG